MTADIDETWQSATEMVIWAYNYLVQPWSFYQLLIIAACFAIALLISWFIEPPLEERARRIRANAGLLRVVMAFLRRTEWIIFILLLWLVRTALLWMTWPSRSYLLFLAMTLSLAWLTVAVLTHIIRSRTLARLLAAAAFIYIALHILELRDDAASALDAFAFTFGDFRLSALLVLQAVLFTTLLLWIGNFVGTFLEARISAIEDLSPSFRVLAGKIIRISLIVLAGAIALSSTGIDLTALTIFSGAVGVGLGFGLQKVVSNFVSGIIILSDKSIKPGDTITLGDTFGWIRELRARFVSVITRDGREYLIPNEDFITQQVINWSFSDRYVRLDVDFGVSYDSDPHEVIRMAKEAAGAIDRVLDVKPPVCWLTGFGTSSLDFTLRFWIDDPRHGLTNIRGQVLIALWDVFKKEGIAIPYPHREVIVKTPITINETGREPSGS